MALDPHPGDFVEDGFVALSVIKAMRNERVSLLYSTPRTFVLTDDVARLVREAGNYLSIVRLPDTLNHKKPLRFIVNPLDAPVAVLQHMNIGEGEVPFDPVFSGIREIGFDGLISTSVFG